MSAGPLDPSSFPEKQVGPLHARFCPAEGGRLESLTFHGVDLVLPAGRVPGFYGDTFWPSPQARFDWPPPPILDAEPYRILEDQPTSLRLQSAPDPDFGYAVTKHFQLHEDRVKIRFDLTNIWAQPQRVAPWQVTRAARAGLLVWATGELFDDADRVVKQREDPGCWYLHTAASVPFPGHTAGEKFSSVEVAAVDRTCKLFADAQGWLAHVHDGVLCLRLFPNLALPQIAPRQGEIELYFNPERDYLELENQGAYVELAPGECLSYPVEWRFAPLAPGIPEDRLTDALLAAIKTLGDFASAPS